jgi:hypothetical protein
MKFEHELFDRVLLLGIKTEEFIFSFPTKIVVVEEQREFGDNDVDEGDAKKFEYALLDNTGEGFIFMFSTKLVG